MKRRNRIDLMEAAITNVKLLVDNGTQSNESKTHTNLDAVGGYLVVGMRYISSLIELLIGHTRPAKGQLVHFGR